MKERHKAHGTGRKAGNGWHEARDLHEAGIFDGPFGDGEVLSIVKFSHPVKVEKLKSLNIILRHGKHAEAVLDEIPVVVVDGKDFPIRIEHKGQVYWLRETKGEKLILTK